MKKVLFVISYLLVMYLQGQQVERNYVLVEIATGTWCVYCPGAALAADDLIANGDPAAIIENHFNDAFETPDSYERIINYYGVTAYPTGSFDGSYDTVVWGHPDTTGYLIYKPIVDARIMDDSDFTLNIFGENDGDDYSITARIQDVGNYSGSNLKLRLVLTESEIEYNWQGLTELNFTNRLMIGGHQGTDLSSYDLSEETDIILDFTFNNSWDDQHCELVIFIQDDDTKEVLQTNKIALTDLYMPITADFSADLTTGCEGTIINFTDLTEGEGEIIYEWSFPGGTPATSSEQNPTVTYPDNGNYDVELTTTDDYTTDTEFKPNYILITDIPVQPEIPEGEEQICNVSTADYHIVWTEYALTFEWELYPSSAGTLEENYNNVTLTPAEGWTGDFTLKVRASNDCGIGEWSDNFEGTISDGPALFEVDGGGGYCENGEGIEVLLNSSENGITYTLLFNDLPTDIQIPGTGSEISFGLQTDTGYYAVEAFNGSCAVLMLEETNIYFIYPPEKPAQPEGEIEVCNDQTEIYTTSGTDGAIYYSWDLYPEEAGIISGDSSVIMIEWNENFSGTVSLSVAGLNTCGEGETSDTLEIELFNCTDINEIKESHIVNIYPNPARDILNISYLTELMDAIEVSIYNNIGQNIRTEEFQSNNTGNIYRIDISGLNSGIYILSLKTSENQYITKKFFKQ